MNLFTYGLDLSTVYLGGSTRVVQTFPVTCEIEQFGGSAVLFGRAATFGAIPNGTDRLK
jgi:hypothetical protein